MMMMITITIIMIGIIIITHLARVLSLFLLAVVGTLDCHIGLLLILLWSEINRLASVSQNGQSTNRPTTGCIVQ